MLNFEQEMSTFEINHTVYMDLLLCIERMKCVSEFMKPSMSVVVLARFHNTHKENMENISDILHRYLFIQMWSHIVMSSIEQFPLHKHKTTKKSK